MGRTILIDGPLGKSLLGFSFIWWACDVLNLIPNNRNGSIMPYKAFHGCKPSFDSSKLFGQWDLVRVMAEGRQKLDERAREG